MSACPPREQLQQLLNEQLGADADREIADHLELCPACQRMLEEMTASASRSSVTIDRELAPSENWLDRLVAAAHTVGPAAERGLVSPPIRVGPYELLRELGRGGMGVVYLAHHAALRRRVAIKMLSIRGEVDRFRTEAEALARLQHPNIIQIHDVGEQNGQPYIVMEYVAGSNLDERLRGKPVLPRLAAELVITLAEAVDAAHRSGIVHRDLKPANVLIRAAAQAEGNPPEGELSSLARWRALTPTDVKITDFGLAMRLDDPVHRTMTGVVVGTPSYMAPEQAAAQGKVGPAADVWALGAILYECLTGRPPFRAEAATRTLLQVMHEDPISPTRLQSGVPRDLETICLKCLEKEPARRYLSARELADDLGRYRRGEPIRARPARSWEIAAKWARRKPTAAALLALLLLLAFVGLPSITALWLQADQQRKEKEQERDRANLARSDLEQAVYASRIILAQRAYLEIDNAGFGSLLDQTRPAPGRPDLRGWEWHYLRGLQDADLHPKMRHSLEGWNFVHGLALFPDGRRAVSVAGYPGGYTDERGRTIHGVPGEVRQWDIETGQCLSQRPEASVPTAVAVSPDGRLIAVGYVNGRVRLLDGETGEPRTPPRALEHRVNNLVFSPDGGALAVASDLELRVWDCKEERERFSVPGDWYMLKVSFRSDGRVLLGVSRIMNGAQAWEVDGGKKVALPLPKEPANAVAFSPDRPLLALSRGKEIEIWDADGTRLLRRLGNHTGFVETLAFGNAGLLASGSDDRSIRLWDAERGTEQMVFRGHTAGVTALAFTRDGRRLVSGDKHQSIKVWDVSHPPEGLVLRPTADGQLGEWIGNLAFAPDARTLLVLRDPGLENQKHCLQKWDVVSRRRLSEKPIELQAGGPTHPFRDFLFSADGRYLAASVLSEPGALRVFSTDDEATLVTIQTGSDPVSPVAVTNDAGTLVYRTRPGRTPQEGGAGELGLVNIATGKIRTRIKLGAGRWCGSACLSPDGRLLAGAELEVTLNEGVVSLGPPYAVVLWDAGSGKELQRLGVERWAPRTSMRFGPTGRYLAAVDQEGGVQVWDLEQGKLAFAPLLTPTPLTGLAFSPDGRRLVTAGLDSRVRMYDAVAGHQLLELQALSAPGSGHYGYTPRVAFSSDGTRLAANGWDGRITLWSAPTRE